jgi:hypothetical protein
MIAESGRPADVPDPVTSRVWRRWDDIAEIFATQTDPDLAGDLDGSR